MRVIIPELIAAGHEITGLARSDTAVAAVSALGATVLRGSLEDLDGLKKAAADSDGVIHLAHRQDLLPAGGIDAVAAAKLPVMLAYGEALAGTGKPLVAAGSIGSPSFDTLGRAATEAFSGSTSLVHLSLIAGVYPLLHSDAPAFISALATVCYVLGVGRLADQSGAKGLSKAALIFLALASGLMPLHLLNGLDWASPRSVETSP